MSDLYEYEFSTNCEELSNLLMYEADRELEERLDNSSQMKYIRNDVNLNQE